MRTLAPGTAPCCCQNTVGQIISTSIHRAILRASTELDSRSTGISRRIFGIDCRTYTVLHNHLHIVLRSRPDVVTAWSDVDVAQRWLRLFPNRRKQDGSPETPTQQEIDMIINQLEVLPERRRRLSDVSWWTRCTAENIARRANREDECTSRFWEGRYKAQILLDEASLLVCVLRMWISIRFARRLPRLLFTHPASVADPMRSIPPQSLKLLHQVSQIHSHPI